LLVETLPEGNTFFAHVGIEHTGEFHFDAFFNFIDSIVGSRESKSATGKSVSEAILSMLLTEMDGIGVRSPFARSTKSDKEV